MLQNACKCSAVATCILAAAIVFSKFVIQSAPCKLASPVPHSWQAVKGYGLGDWTCAGQATLDSIHMTETIQPGAKDL